MSDYSLYNTMAILQDRMNSRVHPDWRNQDFEWHRAIVAECGELLETLGFKWWKAPPELDMKQIQLEFVDIWHFLLSESIESNAPLDIKELWEEASPYIPTEKERMRNLLMRYVDDIAELVLTDNWYSASARCIRALVLTGMTLDEFFSLYVSKNTLNLFRQDHGYKEGTYQKIWNGEEDNVVLERLLPEFDASSETYVDDLIAALDSEYLKVVNPGV